MKNVKVNNKGFQIEYSKGWKVGIIRDFSKNKGMNYFLVETCKSPKFYSKFTETKVNTITEAKEIIRQYFQK